MKSFEILVDGSEPIIVAAGQNAQDNFNLIDMYSEKLQELPNRIIYWFHLESFSSPHVILMMPENMAPEEKHFRIAAEYTKNSTKKHKHHSNLSVIYTLLANVVKTENIGEVEFKSNRKVKKILI